MPVIETFQGEDGQFYFAFVDDNHEIVATSEGYTREGDARQGAVNVRDGFSAAPIVGRTQ